MPEAVLGTSKDIETATGKVRIKLEEGIQSGKILRLKGKGVPNLNGYGAGDLLVHVNVWTPKTLTKEQKNFFQKMMRASKMLRISLEWERVSSKSVTARCPISL